MKKIFLIFTMLLLVLSASSQSLFSNLKFEAPTKLITPQKGKVNVRQRPNLKAPLIAHMWDEDMEEVLRLEPGMLCQVLEDLNGWYKVEYPVYIRDVDPGMEVGYVSKTVVRESPITALDSVEITLLKYDGEEYDYITKTASSTYPYLYVAGRLYGEEAEYASKEVCYSVVLWLGKQVGDVLVFKYPAAIGITLNPNYKGKDVIEKNGITTGPTNNTLEWVPLDKERGFIYFGFDYYGDKELETLFANAIEIYTSMQENSDDDDSPVLYVNDERLQQGW